jgi:hypothetical protein
MNLSTRTKDRENGIRNVAHTSQVRIKGIAGKVREAVLAGAERMPSAKVRGRSAVGAGGFFDVKPAGLRAKIGRREPGQVPAAHREVMQ